MSINQSSNLKLSSVIDVDPMSILKNKTLALHKELECKMGFPNFFSSKNIYHQTLSVFLTFQREIERYSHIFGKDVAKKMVLKKRLRSKLVEQDIQTLGFSVKPEIIDIYPCGLSLNSLAEFYGCLYVSEGSTLGGKVIQKAMIAKYGPAAKEWSRYFNPYEDEMLKMWLSFKATITNEINFGRIQINDVILGASKTFQYLIDKVEYQRVSQNNE